MGMASMEYGLDSGLYKSQLQEEEAAAAQGSSVKGKKDSPLLKKGGERHVAKKISSIASGLKASQKTSDASLLASVYGLQHLQGVQGANAHRSDASQATDALSRQFAGVSFTGLEGLQGFSFEPVKASNKTFSVGQAFSAELSKGVTSVQKNVQAQPFVFPSASELNQCLEDQLCPYAFGDYLKEKRMISDIALSFAGKTYANGSELQSDLKPTLASINAKTTHLDSNTLLGVRLHMEMVLPKCVEGAKGLVNSREAALKKPVAVHVPSETHSSFFSDWVPPLDIEEVAIQTHELAREAITLPSVFQRRVRKISGNIEDGIEIGRLEAKGRESENPTRDYIVDLSLNAGIATAGGGYVAGGLVVLNRVAKVADEMMPSVERFLETSPIDPQKELTLCLTDPEYLPPHYYGLAAKGTLKGIQSAANLVEDTVEVIAKPIKETLTAVGVTDANIAKGATIAVNTLVQGVNALGEIIRDSQQYQVILDK